MNKELLTIEFRYHDAKDGYDDYDCITKTITIGVYDTLEAAIIEGNKALDVLSNSFEVRPDDKFKLHHLFGSPQRLVTNCCYRTKGIQFFAKITKLKFDDLNETVAETFKAFDRYKKFKQNQED